MSGIGQQIRARRQQLGWTQGQAAEGICSPSLLSMAESGRAALSARTLARLAARLGVELGEWLQGRDERRGARSRFALGQALLEAGEWQAAAEQFAAIEGGADGREQIARIGAFEWLCAQAELAVQGGSGERAMELLWDAYERAVVLREEGWQVEIVRLMGATAERLGRDQAADEHYRRAAVLLARGAEIDPDARLQLQEALLRMAVKFERPHEADARAAELAGWLERLRTPSERAALHRQAAAEALERGETGRALRAAEEARREAAGVKRREERIGSMRAYGHHLVGQGRSGEARSWYDRALEEARADADLAVIGALAGELTACLLAGGREEEARTCWSGWWESALHASRLAFDAPAGEAFHQ